MELAREELLNAVGWSQFNTADNKKSNQEHLDFAHMVAKTFRSSEGKKVLDAMIQKYLLADIATGDDMVAIGRRQGRADVVKHILAQIELSNKS